MKSSLAVGAVILTVAIAGCENRADAPSPEVPFAEATTAMPGTTVSPSVSATSVPSAANDALTPVDSLPAFAAVYPDAEVEGEPLMAMGEAGPGGVVTFVTEAEPDAVIAFYRQRAEAAGLATMMSMNQGEARAYGALKQANGASVNVVAAPAEERTSVQLTWSAGQ